VSADRPGDRHERKRRHVLRAGRSPPYAGGGRRAAFGEERLVRGKHIELSIVFAVQAMLGNERLDLVPQVAVFERRAAVAASADHAPRSTRFCANDACPLSFVRICVA
jgi:hypothetical protein